MTYSNDNSFSPTNEARLALTSMNLGKKVKEMRNKGTQTPKASFFVPMEVIVLIVAILISCTCSIYFTRSKMDNVTQTIMENHNSSKVEITNEIKMTIGKAISKTDIEKIASKISDLQDILKLQFLYSNSTSNTAHTKLSEVYDKLAIFDHEIRTTKKMIMDLKESTCSISIKP